MYICLCQPVTDGQIREAVCRGVVCNVRQLQAHFGMAKQCKKCARAAKEVVNETLLSLEQRNKSVVHLPIHPSHSIHFENTLNTLSTASSAGF